MQDKYKDLTRGMTTAVFNKLGGMSGAARFLAGEMTPQEFFRLSYTEDGIIYFNVFSFGKPIEKLFEGLEAKSYLIYDKEALHKDFRVSSGFMTQLAVIRSDKFDETRNLSQVRSCAEAQKFMPTTKESLLLACCGAKNGKLLPALNLGCLVLETTTGTFVVTSYGFAGTGKIQMENHPTTPDERINDSCGFLYTVSRTSFEEL